MSEKVLLIDPPFTEEIWSNYYSEINLGLAYLARIAKKQGYTPEVIDPDSEFITLKNLKERTRNIDPEYVAISSLYGSFENTKRIVKAVKENSKGG